MQYTFTSQLSMEELDQFVATHHHCNLLQSSKWARIKNMWNHLYCGVYRNTELVATAMILIKPLPMGFTMFYIPRGPILDFLDTNLLSYFFKELKVLAKQYRCIFIKMDPDIIKNKYKKDNYQDILLPQAKIEMKNLQANGCIHRGFTMDMKETIQPRFHATVVLENDFDKSLPKHTKRHLQTAKKRFVKVEECGNERVAEFARLTNCTEEAKHICLRNQNYFTQILKVYGKDAKLFLACIDFYKLYENRYSELVKVQKEWETVSIANKEQKKKLHQRLVNLQEEINTLKEAINKGGPNSVSGTLAVCFGNTCEMLYMGTDRAFARYMPAYLSHYAPIKWASDHGYRICNMGGIEGSLQDGLTKFKSNFNPDIIEYVGEFEIPIYHVFYRVVHIAFKVRKMIVHCIRK